MSTVFATRTNTMLATICSTIVSTIKVPDDLFKSAETGTFLDFRPEYTYTDTAGTVPAGAGDFIAKSGDRSPNGADAVQGTSPARARLSARYNYFETTESVGLTYSWKPQGGTETTLTGGIADPNGGAGAIRIEPASGSNRALIVARSVPSGIVRRRFLVRSATGGTFRYYNSSTGSISDFLVADSDWQEISVEYDASSAPVADRITVYLDGTATEIEVYGADLRLTRDTDQPAYQRVGDLSADPGDYDTDGFPYYADKDDTDDVFPVTLGAITGGTVALVGLNGIYYQENWDFAGGTLNIGPTSLPGLPAGILPIVGDLLSVIIVDRATTAAEKTAISAWGKARGAAGTFVRGEYAPLDNGAFDVDEAWTKDPLTSGVPWVIAGGVASIDGSQPSASDFYQIVTVEPGVIYLAEFDLNSGALSAFMPRQVNVVQPGPTSVSGSGRKSFVLSSSSTFIYYAFRNSASLAAEIDNVSLQKLELVP